MLQNFAEKYADKLYFVFRVLVGALFAQHGAQKLFGAFTDNPQVDLISLMGLAGFIELVGGIFIAVGLLTRFVALISAIEMILAYGRSHVPGGLIPIMNGGELALVYLAAFLVIIAFGAGKWALDHKVFKK